MDGWRKKLKLRLPAIALLAATCLFWSRYDRYEPAGPMLLQAPGLADASRVAGDCTETNGCFVLTVPANGKTARVDFTLPAATDYASIRVRGRIKIDGVVVGKNLWSCARLLLTQYDSADKWISGDHGLISESGTKDWEAYEDVFEIFPGAVRVDLNLQQIGLSGTAMFDGIEAQPVRTRASFKWFRLLFSGLWIYAAILYFPRCRMNTRRLKIVILLNVVAILVGTLMPSKWISDATEKVAARMEEARKKAAQTKVVAPVAAPAPAPSKPLPVPPRHEEQFAMPAVEAHMMGHFTLFASLCFLVYLSAALEGQHPSYFVKVGLDMLLFAAVTEALQFLTIDRTAGISDLRIDVYGMVLALILFLFMLPLVDRLRKRLDSRR